MSDALFWLLSFCGFAAVSFLCAVAAWPQLAAVWPSIQDKIDRFRRLPPLSKVLLLVFVGVFIAYGSTKTNQFDQTSGTNGVEIVECGTNDLENVGLDGTNAPTMMLMMAMPFSGDTPPSVTPIDIARGWQLWEVRTNADLDYTMPQTAALATNWWVRGAYEDVKEIGFGGAVTTPVAERTAERSETAAGRDGTVGGWRFPFGSNEYDSAWAFVWGKLRFRLGDAETEIAAVGAPMSAVPYRSRLWTATTTNDARLVTWENFFLNRDTNTPVNAQIELQPTGDFIVRSNAVERIYHYIDDFDWDGDGIPNWSDWDPYWYDGDYAGQSEGTREWVDECVGSGLENGYYKLTATFPQAGFRRTVLTVGSDEVVVAEPGEYVFLLEKGNEYEIGLDPFVGGAQFDAVDDIPEVGGGMSRLTAGRGHWEGKWSKDDGLLCLDPPQSGLFGYVMWTPKLCVSPGEWNPSAGDRTETFAAMLFDRTDWMTEPTYAWESANSSVSFASPSAESTRATWLMGPQESVSAHVTVSFGQYQLESTLTFHYEDDDGDPGQSASFWVEDMPDTLFVNNDNDQGGAEPDCYYSEICDDDIPCATIRLTASEPTNGAIRIENLTGFVGDVYTINDSGRQEAVYAGKTWSVRDATDRSYPLYFNACGKSTGFETSQVKVRWIPEVGPEKTVVRRFTVVEPVAEPICAETKAVPVDGETRNLAYNPCGVAVGRDAYFKIGVEPEAYPDSMIEWEATGDGSVQFVGGSNGRDVRVRGVSPGDVTLSAKLGDCVSPPPSFSIRVVTNRTIRLSAWIVTDENDVPARSVDEIRDMVKMANDIYAQVGVTFDLGDRITVTNIPDAYDINEVNEHDGRWNLGRLTDLASDTGGLECYFVNEIFDDSEDVRSGLPTAGIHTNSGLAVSALGSGVTLAHEIGHAFGMRDIYAATFDGVDISGCTCWEWQPYDWNGGCAGGGEGRSRYYEFGTLQRDVIRLMLMDGEKSNSSGGADITFGDVWGFDIQDGESHQDTGFFTNGRQTDNPQHR